MCFYQRIRQDIEYEPALKNGPTQTPIKWVGLKKYNQCVFQSDAVSVTDARMPVLLQRVYKSLFKDKKITSCVVKWCKRRKEGSKKKTGISYHG